MGPLSAVALFVGFLLLGLQNGGWVTGSPHFFGVVYIVVAVGVLLDAFWVNSYGRWTNRTRV